MTSQLDHPPSRSTKEWLETKLQAFRAEMRLLIILAVVLNQTLFRINLPDGVAFTTSGAAIAVLVAVKVFWINH